MIDAHHQQTYLRDKCAIFLKTAEHFGGLSNMAGGYPLSINGIQIPTSEALYQACRFPHKPDLQKIIIGQKSPMTAKMKSKPFRNESRTDWNEKRIEIMWWCLRVKLAQNWQKFGDLLLSTEDKPIVEESYRDQFWGARPNGPEMLVGLNVLGQLLTTLREKLKGLDSHELLTIEPPELTQFFLINKLVGVVKSTQKHSSLEHIPSQQAQDLFSLSQNETPSERLNLTHSQTREEWLTQDVIDEELQTQHTIDEASNHISLNMVQLTFEFI